MVSGNTPNFNESITPKPFNFGDNQKQKSIHERLGRLVGPGPAAFYKDACRHITIAPPFESSTHIVGHLVREIESALRDVLESISDEPAKTQKKEEHKQEIIVILKALEIPEQDPIAQAWISLAGEDGLPKRAHRDNLEVARPIDKEYLEFWTQMEVILDVVLDKFEGQYVKVFALLDALAQKLDPTAEDAKIIHLHVPNNLVAHQRFFGQLANPKWLPFLNTQGLFSDPPKVEQDPESGGVRHLPWPALFYLEKIAPTNPDLVTEILLAVKDTENSSVKRDLLKITAILPKEKKLLLTAKIGSWLQTSNSFFQYGLIEPGSALMKGFTEDGEEEFAFEIAKRFLEILPDPQPPQGDDFYTPDSRPTTRLESWYYQKFLNEDFRKLITVNPKKSFVFVCDLLVNYLKLERQNKSQEDKEYYRDYSYIKRPAVENHEQNHDRDDTENLLINAIRDIGLQVVQLNSQELKWVILELEARKWGIFKRIAIHFLGQWPEAERDLTAKYLTDESLFNESDFQHEQGQLMNKGFKLLDTKEQNTILEWIENAQEARDFIEVRKKETSVTPAQEKKKINAWQRDQLFYMKNDLPEEWKKRYAEFALEYGEPEHPDFPTYMTSWVGPTSEVNSQELVEMDAQNIIKLLKTWIPKDEVHGFGSTKEGLGRELTLAIKAKPDKFEDLVEEFKDLDPTYVRAYVQAFSELIQGNYQLSWARILDLCFWVVQQPRAIIDRKSKGLDQDPDWGWCRRTIASLLSRGLNDGSIPFELRETVWKIIEPLTQDPDPRPEDESKREEQSDDAYTDAINRTRGEAMNATVEYALWTHRSIEKEIDGKEKLKEGFNLMPEVRIVLEWHLKAQNDPSRAVRSIYGRFLPWLMLIDRKWVLENIDKILPPGQFEDRLYIAAWNTLMLYVPVYNDPFDLLKDRYQEAIQNLGKIDKKRTRHIDRDERVVEHLMLQYGRGKIELNEPLLVSFWKLADDKLRGHAIGFIGRGLRSEKEEIDPKTYVRMKALWESRLNEAKSAENKADYKEEMSAFGWWFISNKFEDKWLCEQYSEALEIGKNIQLDYVVLERLAEISKSLPAEALNILAKLVLSDQPGWAVIGNKGEIVQILTIALASPEKNAQVIATELINRLVSRGHAEFNDLLQKNR